MTGKSLMAETLDSGGSIKINWCKTPYGGSSVFGTKMDLAISKVTGGKSGLIPSDRRPEPQKGPAYRRDLPVKYRDARSYRPGRKFRRDWKTRPSFMYLQ